MTEGTSQGLFVVVAIVIFGIFVGLSYNLFGKTLQPALVNLFETALNVDVEGNEGPVTPPVVEEEVVYFEDENLEYFVAASLYGLDTDPYRTVFEKALEDLGSDFDGSPEQLEPYIEAVKSEMLINNPITFEKIKELTKIDTTNLGFKSLVGLENASNLKELSIWGSKVKDLSPIANLTNLNRLAVSTNDITNADLNQIANLTNLTYLSVAYLDLTDLTPIANLTNLKILDLNNNNIKDLSVLENFKSLEKVYITNSDNLKSVLPLLDLPKLKEVNLYGIPKNNLKGFEELKARKEVHITGLT